jgi:hypothetical protein
MMRNRVLMLGEAVASSVVSTMLSCGLYLVIWGRSGVDRLGPAATEVWERENVMDGNKPV